MLHLTDTAQIVIIITVFGALMLMITCILHKMSKLKDIMDKQPGVPASVDLASVGLPWRRDSSEPSECSICKLEKGHCSANKEPCNTSLRGVTPRNTINQGESVFGRILHEETEQRTAAVETESVVTGRLTFIIEYKASSGILLLKQVTADDLFPWEYTGVTKTMVTIESQVGATHDKQSSGEQTGVHGVSYEHNFEFKSCNTDLDQTHLFLTVWQQEESGNENLIGECMVAMDRLKITSAPEQSLVIFFVPSLQFHCGSQEFLQACWFFSS